MAFVDVFDTTDFSWLFLKSSLVALLPWWLLLGQEVAAPVALSFCAVMVNHCLLCVTWWYFVCFVLSVPPSANIFIQSTLNLVPVSRVWFIVTVALPFDSLNAVLWYNVWQKLMKWHTCTCLLVFFLLGSISLSVLDYVGFYTSAKSDMEKHC